MAKNQNPNIRWCARCQENLNTREDAGRRVCVICEGPTEPQQKRTPRVMPGRATDQEIRLCEDRRDSAGARSARSGMNNRLRNGRA